MEYIVNLFTQDVLFIFSVGRISSRVKGKFGLELSLEASFDSVYLRNH
jgi:hypothetical protein